MVVISLSPFAGQGVRVHSDVVGTNASGGHQTHNPVNANETNSTFYYNIGEYIPTKVGGSDVRIDRITFFFRAVGTPPTAKIELRGYNGRRTGPNDSAAYSTTSTTVTSLTNNSYKLEISPVHTLVNERVYDAIFVIDAPGSSVYFRGGEIEYTLTGTVGSAPYDVIHYLQPRPHFASQFSGLSGGTPTYGGGAPSYITILTGTTNLCAFDVGAVVPNESNGHKIQLKRLTFIWWINATRTGYIRLYGINIDRINDPDGTYDVEQNSNTWTQVSSFTYKLELLPDIEMVATRAYVTTCGEQVATSNTPRIMALEVVYTVKALS
jgi:hypothetical protein